MTIRQQIERVSTNVETATRAGEFAQLAKFILSSGGITKAAFRIETQGSKVGLLGPRLAAILEAGGAGEISRAALQRQKAAATAGDAFVVCRLFRHRQPGSLESLINVTAFDTMLWPAAWFWCR